MSKLVSVQQAAANAFTDYLASTLNNPKVLPKPAWKSPVVVEPRWPDPKKLAARAITLVMSGPRTNGADPVLGWWHHAAKVVPQPPGLPAGMIMWRWTVGWYEQPVQMDIWTLSDIDRDDLIARLDVALHSGPGELSPDQPGGHDPIVDYLVVPLRQQDGWPNAYTDVYFADDGPTLIDTATNAGQSLYRATWRGTLKMLLTIDAPEPKMAKIQFKQWLQESGTAFAGSGDLELDVTATGRVFTRPALAAAQLTSIPGSPITIPGKIVPGA